MLCRALVVAGKAYAPRKLGDLRLVPNASTIVQRLKDAGFLVVVVTNQPDIGNGLSSLDLVEEMHRRLRERVAVDGILMCPHRQTDRCSCRKPKPGMLLTAARRYGIDLSRSFMVGDRTSDVEAGRNAGCRSVFIDRGYAEGGPSDVEARTGSLQGAAAYILSCVHQSRVMGGRGPRVKSKHFMTTSAHRTSPSTRMGKTT